MAHYAIIRDGIVEQVITGVDEDVTQGDVGGSAEAWEAFYAAQPWWNGATVRRCSYNANIRLTYPGQGYIYDADLDQFAPPDWVRRDDLGRYIPPQPYPSWTLDDEYRWQAPVPYPTDGDEYTWDEGSQQWAKL